MNLLTLDMLLMLFIIGLCFWQLFQKMYPNEELFPETTTAGDHQDDGEES